MVERDALNYLVGVAENDAHNVRLQARLEQMPPEDVLEVARMAIKEIAGTSRWLRHQSEISEDEF